MFKYGLILTGALAAMAYAAPAEAQYYYNPGYGYGYNPYYYGYVNPGYGQREQERRELIRQGYRQQISPREMARLQGTLGQERYYDRRGYTPYWSQTRPGVSQPNSQPFRGSPNGGNYYYWLSQQAAQGRLPQSTVNQLMYGGAYNQQR